MVITSSGVPTSTCGIDIMGHEQHRRPCLLADLPDHACHTLLVAQVQAIQGFVQCQDAWPRHQRLRDEQALLLPTGKLPNGSIGI